ncbi:U2 small nuclear RNA auxiliary factor 2 [Gonapodya sp. JEL0774]|nr:U2 small nuclear RNA auxiliary factor 2 [Gonapodya sp. JEL0774]
MSFSLPNPCALRIAYRTSSRTLPTAEESLNGHEEREYSSRSGRDKEKDRDRERDRDSKRSSRRDEEGTKKRRADDEDEDRGERKRERRDRSRDKEREKERDRDRDRDRRDERDRDRDRRDDRERRDDRDRRDRERSRSVTPIHLKKRKINKWDVPPPGYEAFSAEQVKAMGIFPAPGAATRTTGTVSNNAVLTVLGAGMPATAASSVTGNVARQARRLYIGNIPFGCNEEQLVSFFNSNLVNMGLVASNVGNPCMAAQINAEKNYAFVEFRTPPEATAAMAFDGITFMGQSLKIRRPKDYVPPVGESDVPPSIHVPGVVSTNVPDSPNKIYIGGLPTHLNDEQAMEILKTFGELRAFNLVKEGLSGASKGFAFCEYVDPSLTDLVCQHLNGLELGDKKLVVQRASVGSTKLGVTGPMTLLPSMNLPSLVSDAVLHGGHAESTPVIMLLNMVSTDELVDDDEYGDIMQDVHDECSKFGQVENIKIPRPVAGQEVPGLGKIFVQYASAEEAEAAVKSLAGRKFADRTVIAGYWDLEKFEAGDQFKEVREGQIVGEGLHIRMDFQTGKKEAKRLNGHDETSDSLLAVPTPDWAYEPANEGFAKHYGALGSSVVTEQELVLDNLETEIHDLDFAERFSRSQWAMTSVKNLLQSPEPSVRCKAFLVLGGLLSNNPKVQERAEHYRLYEAISRSLMEEESMACLKQELFAFGAMMRGSADGLRHFEENGFALLQKVVVRAQKAGRNDIVLRVRQIVSDMMDTSQFPGEEKLVELDPECAKRVNGFLDTFQNHIMELQTNRPSMECSFDRFDPNNIQISLERDSSLLSAETTKLALTMRPPFELDLLNFILGNLEAAAERLVVTVQSIPATRGELLSKEVRYAASSTLLHVAALANSYLTTPRNLDELCRLSGNPFHNTGAVWQSADLFKGLVISNRAWVASKLQNLTSLLDDALEETEATLTAQNDSGIEDGGGSGSDEEGDLYDDFAMLTDREREVVGKIVSLLKLVKLTFKKLTVRTFVDVVDDTQEHVLWYDEIWDKATVVSSKVDDLASTAQSPPFSPDEIVGDARVLVAECKQLCAMAQSKSEGKNALWWQNAQQQLEKAAISFEELMGQSDSVVL